MLKGLRWPVLVLLVVSTWFSPALAEQPPQAQDETPPNVLVEALVGQIRKLNPLLATYNPVDRDITSLIFEGLTTTNQYGEIIPNLAKSWTVSGDGLQYIVVLRDDILWQDGISFTATDVVFTVQLISHPDFPGADSLRKFWRTVEVDALDTNIVRFRLTHPLASFVDQLRIGIVPEHVLRGVAVQDLASHPFNLSPIGTGPYQIEALTATSGQIDGIQLRVAPVYRQRPEGEDGYALDRIVFRTYPATETALDAYRQGEVNSIGSISSDLLPAAQGLPGLSLYTTVEPHVGVLIYNWERESTGFVSNPRVRLALAHAIDPAALVAQYLSGRAIVADSPLLPNSWAYEPNITRPTYDMEQAQTILATANVSFEPAPPAETESSPEETAPPPEEEAAPPAEGDTTAPLGAEGPAPLGAEGEAPAAETTEPTGEPAPESAAPSQPGLTILTLDDPALVALVNDIAANWGQLGFVVRVDPVDGATLQARLESGDFDAALVEFSFEPSADPDPYVFWHQGQYDSGQNYGGMDDQRVSEALELARRDPIGINRVVYYHEFQELFAERAPALTLYYPLYTYAVDARVQGIQLGFLSTPSDRFHNIKDWTFGP